MDILSAHVFSLFMFSFFIILFLFSLKKENKLFSLYISSQWLRMLNISLRVSSDGMHNFQYC